MAYKKIRMYPKKEGAFVKEFMKDFEKDCNCWFFKTHGEPMQTRGIPDVLCCYEGLFLAFEFKIMRSGKLNITPYQEHTIKKIDSSKGLAFIVWFDEKTGGVGVGSKRFDNRLEAIDFLKNALQYKIDSFDILDSIKTIVAKE